MLNEPIKFLEGDSFTFIDKDGNTILDVSFDMDPGGGLISICAYDTDGHMVAHFGIDFLGVGYPQHGGHDKPPLIVEKVVRKRAEQ